MVEQEEIGVHGMLDVVGQQEDLAEVVHQVGLLHPEVDQERLTKGIMVQQVVLGLHLVMEITMLEAEEVLVQ